VLLVVGGSPVFGASVADAQKQRPPARTHGVSGGEASGEPGRERGIRSGETEAARVEGFLVFWV
jgi:hypothetical protein